MNMNRECRWMLTIGTVASALAALFGSTIYAADPADKYMLSVPGGLAFSEFKGYESWETISVHQSEKALGLIVGNPAMIDAYKAGMPGNGKPFPDGAMMAKTQWVPKKLETFPGPNVPGALLDVGLMVKDSKRFADSGGWGYAMFKYDAATASYRPGTTNDEPAQANDAKCGFACHSAVKSTDYVFTQYDNR